MVVASDDNTDSKVLVVDFGSQYSHLICRRIRELNVFSELCACTVSSDLVEKFHPSAIILSGGPASVYETGAPHLDPLVWAYIKKNQIPILGICYGLQEMMHFLGGKVEKGDKREFGYSKLLVKEPSDCLLFREIPAEFTVWMSHGDKVTSLAPGFRVTAVSENSEMCVVQSEDSKMIGLQFHPEVTHSQFGTQILRNFVVNIAKSKQNWNMKDFIQAEVEKIHKLVGDSRHVIGAVSGGVDSSVGAALLHRALGERFHPILVDTGLLRLNEADEVKHRLESHIPGMRLTVVNAKKNFFASLAGISDPERKRKIIGNLFIETFDETVKTLLGMNPSDCFLLQGTLYPDVIESVSYKGPSHTIKTHHNVGGLPEKMKMQIIEPFRLLFKDEVRQVGLELGLHRDSVFRHPFPGPGLAIRIIGEISECGVETLQRADNIFIEELKRSGEYDKIGQAFVVLLDDVRSVGVMGDCRTHDKVVCLRAVQTSDFMTADWYRIPYDLLATVSTRIVNEVKGINRVCYDVTSKPPATIEWE